MKWEVGMIARSGMFPDRYWGPVIAVHRHLVIMNLFGAAKNNQALTVDKDVAVYVAPERLTDKQCAKLAKWRLTNG